MPPKQKSAKAKASADTTTLVSAPTPNPTTPPPAPYANIPLLPALRAGTLLITAGAFSHVSQLLLSPVYGSIPASLYHDQITTTLFFLPWILKTLFQTPRILPSFLAVFVPLILVFTPITLLYAFPYSGELGAEFGPVVTESLIYYPLVLLASCSAAAVTAPRNVLDDAAPMAASFALFTAVRKLLPGVLFPLIGTSPLFTRCGLTHALAGLSAIAAPSPFLVAALPAVLHSYSSNPLCVLTPKINETLAAWNHTLIARQESNTGYVSIVDNTDVGYRVMRCDHSLLGGEWQSPPAGLEHLGREAFREPIYAIFVILEAVRLVTPPPANPDPRALSIGLGIGTSADALIRHGVQTDIVELDPVVYKFAKDYFSLSPNHTAYIEDAVGFVERERAAPVENRKKYEYIIHDVFTGGAVPAELFTTEMFEGLKELLVEDGVIAINWAGDLKLNAARSIIKTVRSVFSSCKAYREEDPDTLDKSEHPDEDFTNMVLFCSKSPSRPITFRRPTMPDFQNSIARRNYLYPQFSIDLDNYWGDKSDEDIEVLTRENIDKLKEWQKKSAVGHWRVIRGVVPGRVWEMY